MNDKKKLKKILNEGQKRNRKLSSVEKEFQSEIPEQYSEDDLRLLKCTTSPRKTLPVFELQEQMIETRAWKKLRGLVECGKYKLCGENRQQCTTSCILENGLLPEDTKWFYNVLGM